MKKRSSTQYIFLGKNIPPTESTRTPFRGEPNSNILILDSDDKSVRTIRKLDNKGFAKCDLDVKHNTHGMRDHAHDIRDLKRVKKERSLSKPEKYELEKAKRKGVKNKVKEMKKK